MSPYLRVQRCPRKALRFRDNVTSFVPELENLEPGPTREITAIQDVIYIEEMAFIQLDSRNLDVATDFAGHNSTVVYNGKENITKSAFLKILLSPFSLLQIKSVLMPNNLQTAVKVKLVIN